MRDASHRKCIPIVAIFRSGLAAEDVDQWVMHPNGTPRSDRELATEVLIEVRRPVGARGQTVSHALGVADILKLDSAAAIVVSTYLAVLPRVTGRYWTKGHLLRGGSRFAGKKLPAERPRIPQQWREVS
ncbi:hypothetical protein [Variovorax paradoxus]|uniref:hypothetical protein n=1 Tax=Variovorax paradoxus TaxID=34073 RepID=UPI0027801EE1|nr:hypothetical protein [Variovorax paradoxus]MDP9932882.1 hypothetical protein [Variovorax paradoxus]